MRNKGEKWRNNKKEERSKSTCLQKEICSCKKLTCSLNRLLLIWWWKQMIIFQYKWFFRSSTLESSELLFEMISSHKQQVSDPFCPTLRTPVVQMCKSLPSCDPSLGEFLGDLPGSTLLFYKKTTTTKSFEPVSELSSALHEGSLNFLEKVFKTVDIEVLQEPAHFHQN